MDQLQATLAALAAGDTRLDELSDAIVVAAQVQQRCKGVRLVLYGACVRADPLCDSPSAGASENQATPKVIG